MKKHIIFKGKPRTGKSFLSRLIFACKSTYWVDGRTFPGSSFLFDPGTVKQWDFDNVVIDDLRKDFNIEEFYSLIFADTMVINSPFRETKTVKTPRFIFLLDSEKILLPECCPTFQRRFHVLDFDKDPISDLMTIIQEEKITINTVR